MIIELALGAASLGALLWFSYAVTLRALDHVEEVALSEDEQDSEADAVVVETKSFKQIAKENDALEKELDALEEDVDGLDEAVQENNTLKAAIERKRAELARLSMSKRKPPGQAFWNEAGWIVHQDEMGVQYRREIGAGIYAPRLPWFHYPDGTPVKDSLASTIRSRLAAFQDEESARERREQWLSEQRNAAPGASGPREQGQ